MKSIQMLVFLTLKYLNYLLRSRYSKENAVVLLIPLSPLPPRLFPCYFEDFRSRPSRLLTDSEEN